MSERKTHSAQTAIAQRLRIARQLAGLSQGQVAAKLGLHRPSVSEMEAGRRGVKAEELAALAELYQVDLGWLSGGTDQGEVSAEADERVLLAARELAKLESDDLDRVMTLLKALRK